MLLGVAEVALALMLWHRGPVDDPLRWSDPLDWLRATTAENALVEVGRVVLLALVAWMVVATALALAARLVDVLLGTTACIAAVSHVVPRFILGLVVTAMAASAPVLAQTRAPVPPVGPVRDGRVPSTLLSPTAAALQPSPAPPAPTAVPIAVPGARAHVVIAGESLWSIGRDQVSADDAALFSYWRALCDANRATLRSGDLDVIYPGETVVLPE